MAKEGEKGQRYILGLRGNALIASTTEFIIDCGIFLTEAFWSLYVLALGATIAELGLFSLITGLLPAFLIAPMGYLGDRVSRRKLVIAGTFISSLGPLMNAFATNWVGLMPGTLIGSLNPMIRPARQALMAEDISPSERGKAFSTVFTLMMLPDTFMPPIAGYFLDQLGLEMGMRYMLLTNASLRFLVALLRLKLLKEGKNTPNPKPSLHLNTQSAKGTVSEMFRPIVSIDMLRVMLMGSSVASFSMGIMGRFQSVFVVNIIGLSKTEWGIINAGVGIIRVLTRIPLGGLTDRWGRRRSILINYCLQPLTILAFASSRDFYTVLLSMAARILAFNFGGAAWEAMLVDISPSSMRGSVYGSMGMVDNSANAVAPLFGSAIWDTFGPEWVFHSAALGRVFSATVLYKFLKEPQKRED